MQYNLLVFVIDDEIIEIQCIILFDVPLLNDKTKCYFLSVSNTQDKTNDQLGHWNVPV